MTDVTVVTVLAGQGTAHVPVWPHGRVRMRHDGRVARTGGSAWPPHPDRGKPPSSGATVLIIWGIRVFFRTTGQGLFHCPRCGGDRRYRRRAGRRFLTLFFIPVIPLTRAGEHVQCTTCRARYHVGALRAPTAAQMQAALPAGMRAAACHHAPGGRPGLLPGTAPGDPGDHRRRGTGLRRRRPRRRPGRARPRLGAGPDPGGRPACRSGPGVVPRRGGPDRDGRRPAHRGRACRPRTRSARAWA